MVQYEPAQAIDFDDFDIEKAVKIAMQYGSAVVIKDDKPAYVFNTVEEAEKETHKNFVMKTAEKYFTQYEDTFRELAK